MGAVAQEYVESFDIKAYSPGINLLRLCEFACEKAVRSEDILCHHRG
jgi:hypothetical protein